MKRLIRHQTEDMCVHMRADDGLGGDGLLPALQPVGR